MWTLVLIAVDFQNDTATATATIPGFSSEDACREAGRDITSKQMNCFFHRFECIEVR
jgi:hypothetical protein